MQSQTVTIHNIGTALSQHWDKAVAEDEIKTSLETGEVGRVIHSEGEGYAFSFADRDGKRVPEREKKCGGFRVNWNPLRSLKVGALKAVRNFGPQPTPTGERLSCGFSCSNPELDLSIVNRSRILIEDGVMDLAALQNAFPYVPSGHYMFVPFETVGGEVVFPHVKQRLNRDLVHEYLSTARYASDWAVAFNSLHAGASVWHQHAHLLRTALLPIEEAFRVKVDRYSYPYGWPAGCLIIENCDTDTLMDVLGRLRGIPVNLLIRGTTAFVFGRRREWELCAEFPTGAVAIMELCGRLLVGNELIWANLTEELISTALRKATLTVEELLAAVLA